MNPQGYAGANPVMNTDPSGLRFVPDEGLAEQGGGYGRTEDLTPDDGLRRAGLLQPPERGGVSRPGPGSHGTCRQRRPRRGRGPAGGERHGGVWCRDTAHIRPLKRYRGTA